MPDSSSQVKSSWLTLMTQPLSMDGSQACAVTTYVIISLTAKSAVGTGLAVTAFSEAHVTLPLHNLKKTGLQGFIFCSEKRLTLPAEPTETVFSPSGEVNHEAS
jgi:hypothetical protein